MLFNIYFTGFIVLFIWWGILSIVVFGKKSYHNSSESLKESVDEIHTILEQFSIVNAQFTYLFFSLLVSLVWPLILIYFLIKKIIG